MPDANNADTRQMPPVYWKTLRYFSIYRLCVSASFVISLFFQVPGLPLVSRNHGPYPLAVVCLYFLVNLVLFAVLNFYQRHFNRQLSIQVLLDVLVLTWLTHIADSLRDSLGIMLLVTLAGAGLIGQGTLAIFYAAAATLSILFEGVLRVFWHPLGSVDFLQTGLFCAGSFTVAISARLLASRVITNEELARKRGEALKNQTIISQRVIEEMQDGVLVLNREGYIKQHNPRVKQLLGLGNPQEHSLAAYSTELALGFRNWRAYGSSEPAFIRAPASGIHLRARFIATGSSEGDVLILLEDLGRLQEQARQLKLAALGRLTASIAHEIRNPLSAIQHAGELIREESTNPGNDRLLRIVLDNTRRVERIINDVLEIGRRDRIRRELISLNQALPLFVEEFVIKEGISADIIRIDVSGSAAVAFDRSHFQQILWNLVGNALRYSRREPGSVLLRTQNHEQEHRVDIHVIDDGKGISEAHREEIFEPFFTTHSRGTGLGLYIARELCEANDAKLELLDSSAGADFCISGESIK